MVAGSIPAGPTNYNTNQNTPDLEALDIRGLLELLLGPEGKRRLRLRRMQNSELFDLYDGELISLHRSSMGLYEARRTLGHFRTFLGDFPPTPELAKKFLSQFSELKTNTVARYTAILKGFMAWYGEPLDIKIRTPKTLPSYVDKSDIDKLLKVIQTRKTYKRSIERDTLIIDLAIHTGLRRTELANLKIGDIDIKKNLLIVRGGKGGKDRAIPLSENITGKIIGFIDKNEKSKNDYLFGLSPATISDKIKKYSNKAGVNIHTHSLRDYFATTLSEKGATIREIQALLGHANLTHTERYTLHTDKHLKNAIELLDTPDTRGENTENIKMPERAKPLLIIKSILKPPDFDPREELGNCYFSHFEIKNDGNAPAVKIEIQLLDKNKDLIELQKENVIGIGDKIEFNPMFTSENENGDFHLMCKYKMINKMDYLRTVLPFNISKSSTQGEIYIIPGELTF